MSASGLNDAERTLLRGLNAAHAANDARQFHALLAELLQHREATIQADVVRISSTLRDALASFRMDSRIAVLTEKDIPDARQRLDHVVTLTEEAAHRTLDLIERSVPLADSTAKRATDLARAGALADPTAVRAFLDEARMSCELVRGNLNEVMLAQGFQDLTGQIIRSVMKLVAELESALANLARLSGDVVEHATMGEGSTAGQGPVVPGVTKGEVASGQTDVDALLSGLGM